MTSLAKRLSVPVAAAAVLAGSTLAHATVLYSTGFDGPTYTDGALIGQDGWALTSSTVNPLTVSNTATNGSVALTTTGQDANRQFSPVTTDSIYLSADITLSAAGSGDYFLHLGQENSTSLFYARIYAKSSGSGFVMAMGTSSGTVNYGSTELAFGTTYHILARYDFVTGAANDTGALFVNPADPFGSGDTAYVAATTTGTDATSIGEVNLRQGSTGSAPTLVVDNISVQTVPGPASLALLGLGGLAIGRRRR